MFSHKILKSSCLEIPFPAFSQRYFPLKGNRNLAIKHYNYGHFKHHTANSLFLLPLITYRRDGENFLIYQRNSCLVIIFFILVTSLTKNVLR